MPNRAERRAAERLARKQAPSTSTQPAISENPNSTPFDFSHETLAEPAPAKTATPAQIAANQANARLSTGATSAEGKQVVSQNRRTHGLTSRFQCLPHENPEDLRLLTESIYAEYQPVTDTECRLADSVIQHYWLMQRALNLQEDLLLTILPGLEVDAKKLALFLRYQTTHERSYYKAQRELRTVQKERRKQEIGFESQKAQTELQTREKEAHDARCRLAHAKAMTLEVNALCRKTMEAPLPGTTNIPLQEVMQACSQAIAHLVYDQQFATAA